MHQQLKEILSYGDQGIDRDCDHHQTTPVPANLIQLSQQHAERIPVVTEPLKRCFYCKKTYEQLGKRRQRLKHIRRCKNGNKRVQGIPMIRYSHKIVTCYQILSTAGVLVVITV